MCDELTAADNEAYLKARGALSRRTFTTLAGGAALMAALPTPANAEDVLGSDVTVETPDGKADCYFVHPKEGTHPAVLIWPDIVGLRPAFKAMAKRLAQSGYAVLVVNPYYRKEKAPVVPEGASFRDPAVREKLIPLARSLSGETTDTDAKAFAQYLEASGAVDTSRGMGVQGYCMGGPLSFRTAYALPDRIRGVGSFHGGGLVREGDDSPHRLVASTKADYLVAIAENDDERAPDDKTALREAFDAAGLKAEIEVYEGTLHGWCPPDSQVYNEEQAERAWSRLLALYGAAL